MLILLLCILPLSPITHDHFDVLELNHYYDTNGQHIFDQVLFLDFNGRESRYEVQAWRLTEKGYGPRRTPHGCEVLFNDKGTLRKVTADSCRESWTQHDPETIDRLTLPPERRRELTRGRK